MARLILDTVSRQVYLFCQLAVSCVNSVRSPGSFTCSVPALLTLGLSPSERGHSSANEHSESPPCSTGSWHGLNSYTSNTVYSLSAEGRGFTLQSKCLQAPQEESLSCDSFCKAQKALAVWVNREKGQQQPVNKLIHDSQLELSLKASKDVAEAWNVSTCRQHLKFLFGNPRFNGLIPFDRRFYLFSWALRH